MITTFKRIISEEAAELMNGPALTALASFVDQHGGEDLIRHLHAQDVEIVAHTNGALLKCFRTDSTDIEEPENCWQFFAGRYEIDHNHLRSGSSVLSISGFTEDDYYDPIQHILTRTKEGKLTGIDPGTLIVIEVTSQDNPAVRMHVNKTEAKMVVVGVKYDVTEDEVKNLLNGTPKEIEKQAIKWSGRWESHAQLRKVADLLGTDSIPLFFRGKLSTTQDAVQGMDQSATADPLFRKILDNFLFQAGENPTEKDYEKFFREALRRFHDMDIRHLDHEGKVQDATAITKQSYQDLLDRVYRRYDDVAKEVGDTIDQYGENSEEHQQDYRDLNYLGHWLRDQVGKMAFAGDSDPISMAIHSLEDADGDVNRDRVLQWVRRHLEEEGLINKLYAAHIRDENVPSDRHTGRGPLWEMFLRELTKIVGNRLDDVIQDAK